MFFVPIGIFVAVVSGVEVGGSLVSDESAANRCGPNSLAVCTQALGRPIPESELRRRLPPTGEESSLADLQAVAEEAGLVVRGVRWDGALPELPFGSAPAILPVMSRDGRPHFVAMLAHVRGRVCIVDDPHPAVWMTIDRLRSAGRWNGWALHVGESDSRLGVVTPRPSNTMRLVLWGLAGAMVLTGALGWRSRRPAAGSSAPSGFSAVELLVVLAIVSLLIALVAPAVMGARESARRTECAHRMRQMLLAAQSYESRFGCWPPSTVPFRDSPGISHVQNLSFHARLLPDLERTELFAEIDPSEIGGSTQSQTPVSSLFNPHILGRRVTLFECPSDAVPAGGTSYRLCGGASLSSRQVVQLARGLRELDWRDGRSQTVILSERVVGDMDDRRYSPDRDVAMMGRFDSLGAADEIAAICQQNAGHPLDHASQIGAAWLYSGYVHTWYNHVLPPNSAVPDCAAKAHDRRVFANVYGHPAVSARSLHRGGVNVGLGDGAVRFVGQNVDLELWRALATRYGDEVVTSP